DRLLRLGEQGKIELGAERTDFLRGRDAIAAAIEAAGFNSALGAYVSELGGDKANAALLLMPRLGYRDPTDPPMRGTSDSTPQRLGHAGLLARSEPDYDCLASREGAFGMCGFWAVDHLARRGDVEQAERTFERLLGFGNDLGLFGEEIDVDTGAARGNFPQAFTHVGLINAALAIERAGREP